MDKAGFLDDVFEQGGQVVQKTSQHVKAAPANLAKAAVGQVAPGVIPTESSPDNVKSSPKPPAKSLGQAFMQQLKPDPEKHAQEQARLVQLRRELHQSYYQNLVNRPKPKDEPQAEKIERQDREEEQKKFLEEKKQEEKKLPINTKQGTGEKQTGIGG